MNPSSLADIIDKVIRKYRLPFSISDCNGAIARVLVDKNGNVVLDADTLTPP